MTFSQRAHRHPRCRQSYIGDTDLAAEGDGSSRGSERRTRGRFAHALHQRDPSAIPGRHKGRRSPRGEHDVTLLIHSTQQTLERFLGQPKDADAAGTIAALQLQARVNRWFDGDEWRHRCSQRRSGAVAASKAGRKQPVCFPIGPVGKRTWTLPRGMSRVSRGGASGALARCGHRRPVLRSRFASTRAWISVASPPRERPMDSAGGSFRAADRVWTLSQSLSRVRATALAVNWISASSCAMQLRLCSVLAGDIKTPSFKSSLAKSLNFERSTCEQKSR